MGLDGETTFGMLPLLFWKCSRHCPAAAQPKCTHLVSPGRTGSLTAPCPVVGLQWRQQHCSMLCSGFSGISSLQQQCRTHTNLH